MKKARFTDEQIVRILQEADRDPIATVAKRHGVGESSIYVWRKPFGDMGTDDDPEVALILSHCLLTGNVELVKSLLTQHPNLYCEMSARSKSHYPNIDNERIRTRVIYGEDFAKDDWIKLINALPTRFMVGTDTYNPNVNFEQNIAEIRKGLLARLQPASIELVAYKNAVRVIRLD